jgi:hypothetical protein
MFRVTVAVCIIAAVFGAPFDKSLDSEWEAYKVTHKKNYVSKEEESLRYRTRLISN